MNEEKNYRIKLSEIFDNRNIDYRKHMKWAEHEENNWRNCRIH